MTGLLTSLVAVSAICRTSMNMAVAQHLHTTHIHTIEKCKLLLVMHRVGSVSPVALAVYLH
jgi:hypothetical protein